MLITNYNDMVRLPVVKEAYFGASANLLKGVKCLEKITEQIRNSGEMELANLNINESKENIELCKLFEKEFGFKKMVLHWDNTSIPNAYTYPGGILLETNPDPGEWHAPRSQKERYYDKNHRYTCVVVVMMNLIRILKLTARESMAIILHEIGHNFDNTAATTLFWLIVDFNTLGIAEVQQLLERHVFMPIKMWFQNTFPWIVKIIDIPTNLLFNLSLFPVSIFNLLPYAKNPMMIIYNAIFGVLLRQASEEYADEFAATYGFGPDLASAANKFDDPSKMNGYTKRCIYKIPVLRTLYDLMEGPFFVALQALDCHPFNNVRIGNAAKKLEKDYNSPEVPKAMKPEIKKQIEAIHKIQRQNHDQAVENGLYFTAFRQTVLNTIKGNKMSE